MKSSVLFLAIAIGGCAALPKPPSVYESWGQQITSAPSRGSTISDISLLLGAEPVDCTKTVATPKAGLLLNSNSTVVAGVMPNSIAERSGIRAGETILEIDGRTATNGQQAVFLLERGMRSGDSVVIKTNRGVRTFHGPSQVAATQCYWNVGAGDIHSAGGSAGSGGGGGYARYNESSYTRYFRASCRFINGVADTCTANWQE